ncbi:ATP-binding cassette domain-containing protein, partial [Clostridioides difficile]
MAYIEVQHEFKIYQMGDNQIVANRDVNFTIEQGQIAVILGPSGAGKSTVLNMLGGMDSPTK